MTDYNQSIPLINRLVSLFFGIIISYIFAAICSLCLVLFGYFLFNLGVHDHNHQETFFKPGDFESLHKLTAGFAIVFFLVCFRDYWDHDPFDSGKQK